MQQLYPKGQPLVGKDLDNMPVLGEYRGMTQAIDPDGPLFADPVPMVAVYCWATSDMRLCRPHEVSEWTFAPEREDAPLADQ